MFCSRSVKFPANKLSYLPASVTTQSLQNLCPPFPPIKLGTSHFSCTSTHFAYNLMHPRRVPYIRVWSSVRASA